MEYQIILPYDLEADTNNFVIEWDENSEFSKIAQAKIKTVNTQLDFNLFNDTVIIISTVGSSVTLGVLTNAIYDVLKKLLSKKKPKSHIKIIQLEQPNRTRVFLIEIEDEQ